MSRILKNNPKEFAAKAKFRLTARRRGRKIVLYAGKVKVVDLLAAQAHKLGTWLHCVAYEIENERHAAEMAAEGLTYDPD